ncbi:MAG: BatD family protein [Bacteroidales bacterium]
MKQMLFSFWLILCLFTAEASGSDVTFSASAPSRVAAGERFRLVFSLNARPEAFDPPELKDFRLISGPSQSTSSSTQIINNNVTTSLTVSYTFIVEAKEEGEFVIGSAIAKVDGKEVRSDPVSILVSGEARPGSQPASPGTGQSPSAQGPQLPGENDLFIRAEINNARPYQSEQVIIAYKIYTRVPVSRYSIQRLPSYRGFWSENITPSEQPGVTTEVIDGITYNVVEIRRVALFPQQSGELVLEPLEVECLVRVRSQQGRGSLFDDFFSGTPFDSFQTLPQTIRSETLVVSVRPLPAENRPAAFNGLVGSYELSGTLQPAELHVNEAANLSLTISGEGNLKMLEEPGVLFPPDFEVYDPNVIDDIRSNRNGINGSRSFDFLLIPRGDGAYEIPPVEMAYFDPDRGQYMTKRTGPFHLEVMPSEQSSPLPTGSQERIREIATDIRFISTDAFDLTPAGRVFFRSRRFFLWLTTPFLVAVILLVFRFRQVRLRGNAALMRTRMAEKLAKKRLRKASLFLKAGERPRFYEEISHALWGYLSDKLSIPVSRLNKETVMDALKQRGITTELASQSIDAIAHCEFARFAPGDQAGNMEETYGLAMKIIVGLEKGFRIKHQAP